MSPGTPSSILGIQSPVDGTVCDSKEKSLYS